MNIRRFVPIFVTACILILFQLYTAVSGRVFYLTQLTMSIYYSVVAVGLSLLMGYAGQISLGQAGFFAIGGYVTAVLTTNDLSAYAGSAFVRFLRTVGVVAGRKSIYGGDIVTFHPWFALIVSVFLTIAIAVLIGIPVLRLRGHYLAMATLGFGIIVGKIAVGTEIFGEADGISAVPGFPILPGLTVSGSFSERIQNYYIALFFLLLVLILVVNLVHSRVGRGLQALHGSEDAAAAMGVNTEGYKLKVFVISAVLTSLTGFFLTHYKGSIGPSEAGTLKSVRYVAIVAVGGMANIWGTLTVSLVLNFLSLRGAFGSYDDAVFGLILVGAMLFSSRGSAAAAVRKIMAVFRKRKVRHDA